MMSPCLSRFNLGKPAISAARIPASFNILVVLLGTPAGRPTRRLPGSNGASSPPLPSGIERIFFTYFIASAFGPDSLPDPPIICGREILCAERSYLKGGRPHAAVGNRESVWNFSGCPKLCLACWSRLRHAFAWDWSHSGRQRNRRCLV